MTSGNRQGMRIGNNQSTIGGNNRVAGLVFAEKGNGGNGQNGKGQSCIKGPASGNGEKKDTDGTRPFSFVSGSPDDKWMQGAGRRAQQFMDNGHYQQAITECSKMLEKDPKNIWVMHKRAAAYVHLKEFEKAQFDQRTIVSIQPNYENWLGLARTCYELNQNDETLKACNNALQFRKDAAPIYGILGSTFLQMGEYRKSAENCRKAISLAPGDFGPRWTLGLTQIEMGREDTKNAYRSLLDAERLMNKDSSVDPHTRAGICSDIAKAYSIARKYGLGARYFKRSLDLNPDVINTYKRMGILYYYWGRNCTGGEEEKNEKYQLALTCFTKVITDGWGSALAYGFRGLVYQDLGKYEKAVSDYKESLRVENRQARPYRNIAACYIQMGKIDEAKKVMAECYTGPLAKLH